MSLFSRLVCECILACEKLQLSQQDFWVQCFQLMKRIIGGVDYKGVREIMKVMFHIEKLIVAKKIISFLVFFRVVEKRQR